MPYIFHIEGQIDEDTSAIASYWYAHTDLASGIAHAVFHAKDELEWPDAHLGAVEFASDNDPPIDEAYETDENGLWSYEEYACYPFEPSFWFPTGIIPSLPPHHDGIDPSDIAEAYATGLSDDTHYLEIVVDQRRLWPVFTAIFHALPTVDGLEIRMLEHWENSRKTELWVGNDQYSGQTILQYLERYSLDLICNGGVEIAVYCRAQRCTLRITEHKLIAFYANDFVNIAPIEALIIQLGFTKTDHLLSIETRCQHYHYTPQFAAPRVALSKRLKADNFEIVDSWSSSDK